MRNWHVSVDMKQNKSAQPAKVRRANMTKPRPGEIAEYAEALDYGALCRLVRRIHPGVGIRLGGDCYRP